MNANSPGYWWSKYELLLMSGYRNKHPRNFKQKVAILFKGVLDFDLQTHPGARTLASGVIK